MIFAREEFSHALVNQMVPLMLEHHKEVPGIKDVPFDPDYSVYENSAKSGALRIYTVRHREVLYGYQVFFVANHPHSRRSLQANQDILYLCKPARRGLNGYKFIKWCTEQLKSEGVEVVYQHISARNDFGHLLERMGFEIMDLVYSMKLEAV